MNPRIKNIIIFSVIFIALIIGYVVFFGKKAPTPSLGTTAGIPAASSTNQVGQSAVGKEFLTSLLNVRNIKLDDSVFANPAFKSLQDFELSLIQEANPGRNNPFLPLGADQQAPAPQTSPTPSPSPASSNSSAGGSSNH